MKTFSLWFIFCCLYFAAEGVFAQFGGPQQLFFATNGNALTVTGYQGHDNPYPLVIPSSTNGLPITSIADEAFYENSDVGSVTIPDSITNIGSGAFEGSRLDTIAIGSGVISIGSGAFGDCLRLGEIQVDPGNTNYSSVYGVLFDKTGTTLIQFADVMSDWGSYLPPQTYAISNGVTTIADSAFAGAPYLVSVTMPDSVTSIGDAAFSQCDLLTDVAIGNGVTNIATYAFYECGDLASATIPIGVTTITNGVFYGCNGMTNITLPNSVTSIGYDAFAFCAHLHSIAFPNSLTDIGDRAFSVCNGFTNVIIPNSVTNLGSGTFEFCENLVNIFFQGNAPATGIQDYTSATAYYLPGTTGWSNTYGGIPALLWNPQIPTNDLSFGVSNKFGFTITGTTNIPIAVQACSDLASGAWSTVQSCVLTNGSIYFSDSGTNYSSRFYRINFP